ncbi:apolipoprotein N-acyltransferase [Aquipluma nitroreducens]|uniref:Apolipoprotein N-acyltransferase n=1 Tax=Aquipluma nitroreducens TaxID=2010828 RepID=A0A5K7S5D4_9BACT|nr:apolipoprotein N-acyltransferase [Aquipluma nitroreducens]BBE16771.1 apolipoprotein N-acyltransferase [Aquipluma nitroreducens]
MRRVQLLFLSAISGILLSFPWIFPGLDWVLLFAFVPLLLVDSLQFKQRKSENLSSSFLFGFVAFLIWNIFSTWWISYVSLLGMLFITSLNSLFMSSVWWLKNKVHQKFGATSGYFSLIVFWIAFEFLNHHGLLPWPWLTLGNGFANTVKIIQWYEFTGVLGGSVWILLSNILIFIAVRNLLDQAHRKFVRSIGLALSAIISPIALSSYSYFNYSEKGVMQNVVALQPNIDPYTQKFVGMSTDDQISKLISLAESKITDSTDLILAPETSWPPLLEDSLAHQSPSLLPLTEIMKRFPDVSFIVGAITQRKFRNGEQISNTARQSDDGKYFFDVFNSAVMIDRTCRVQFNHKNILVAGVEKDPFREYFSFLPDYMLDLGGINGSLASGKEPKVFDLSGTGKIGSVICFESVFGEHVRQLVMNGANYIAVLTNDGWWKDFPGVWQHFGYSKIRAIETRRSVVRSANTGISGCINQRGDVLVQTKIDVCDGVSSRIGMNNSITFYVRHGDYLGWISLFLSGMIGIYFGLPKVGKGQKKSALIRL